MLTSDRRTGFFMSSIFAYTLLPIFLSFISCGDPCKSKVNQQLLESAANEPGAEKLPSGLIYQELKRGLGPNPGLNDKVYVRYTGMLTDSTVFDYTLKYRSPRKIELKNTIPGWKEGLRKMNYGSKAKLTIPPHLGYGKKGKKFSIPGCAVLIFEIELLGIEKSISDDPTGD